MRDIDPADTMKSGRVDLMFVHLGQILELYSPVNPRHEAIFSLSPTVYKHLITDEEGGYPDCVGGFMLMVHGADPMMLSTPFHRFRLHSVICRDEPMCYYLYDARRQLYTKHETGRITAAKLYTGNRTLRLF